MALDMATRKALAREVQERYGKSGKKEKGVILHGFCRLTGYHRGYAARLLRRRPGARAQRSKGKPGRRRRYGEEVVGPLKRLWAIADGICGKRLGPFLPELIAVLERCGEIKLAPAVRERLLTISAPTIDRLLAEEKKRLRVKARSGTKPGSLLKRQIPVRTFADWDEKAPGFVEVDLVSHDGGDARGEYIQSLDLVDVYSGWTESRAVKNKAQRWVFQALQGVIGDLPFPLLGLDCDNGAEFINNQLLRFCQQHQITFTRSRPYQKNDSCHVEQKNWTLVRKTVGYARYHTQQQLRLLNQIYALLRLYTNFFQPTMKLAHKTRQGSRVTKRYHPSQTPYQRLLACPDIPPAEKHALTRQYLGLNPAALMRQIVALQTRLFRLASRPTASAPRTTPPKPKNGRPKQPRITTKKEVTQPPHFEYIFPEATITRFEYFSK